MKFIGYLLATCVVLAIVKAAVVAVILLIVLSLVIGAISKPRETMGLFGFLLIANLFVAYPVSCLIIGGALVGVALIKSSGGA